MSEASPASTPTLPDGLGSSLRRKLGAVRRKLVRVEVMRRLAVALTVALIGMALFLTIDWVIDLAMDVRMTILIGLGVLVGVLLLRAGVALFTQRRDEESLALLVEKREPGFRSRLIASVQFAKGKATVPDEAAQAMVQRMVADTESYAEPMALTEVVNTRPLKRALLILLLLGGLATGGYYAGGAITQDLLKRAFLSDLPVPRATRVVWTSRELKIGIGDAVTLEAQVEGHEPSQGTLRIRYSSGRKQTVRMERRSEGNRYAATIENVQESFTFVAAVNDGRSERETVRALPRPTVIDLVGTQSYPEYTKLAATEHKPGEFLLFPQSKLQLRIQASQDLKTGAVRLLGGRGEVVSSVDNDDPRILHASFSVADLQLTGFTIEMVDLEEMHSKDATVYRLDVLSDEPPKVRIVKPSRQRELVTGQARVLVGYEAEDRFGIEKIVLAYKVGEEGAAQRFDLPIAQKGATKVSEPFDWELEQIEPVLQVGDEIEFWIEAHDQNANTEAGRSASRILKVVTPREKRDDLLSRVGDSLGRIDQATDDQERLNAVLSKWIRAQNSLSTPPPTPEKEQ